MSFSLRRNSNTFVVSGSPITLNFWDSSANNIYNTNSGNVGIGTQTPNYTLDVSGSFRTRIIFDATNFAGNVNQILTKNSIYGNNLIWSYQGNQYQGYDIFPENTSFQVTYDSSSGIYKNGPGVLGQNGCMFFPPYNNGSTSKVFLYNPYTGNRAFATIGTQSSKNNFSGGSMTAPNGSMYFLPYGQVGTSEGFDSDASGILVINPYITSGSTMISLEGNNIAPIFPSQLSCNITMTDLSNAGGLGWRGLSGRYILSATGSSGPDAAKTVLYGIPYNSSQVLKINWRTNTTNLTDLSGWTVANYPQLRTDVSKCYGGVLAPNGRIYCIPNNSACVPIITPNLTTADAQNFTNISGITDASYGLGSDDDKWRGGCLGPDGIIYCAPYKARKVLYIDPSNNTFNFIPTTVTGNYCGATLAPNGKIYCAPLGHTSALVIDPVTKSLSYVPLTNNGTYFSFGPILTPQGQVCLSPTRQDTGAQSMAVIKTGLPIYPSYMLAPELNHS